MADFNRLQSYGGAVVLEANGASIPADGFAQAADLDLASTDSPGFGWFDLAVNFSLAVTTGIAGYYLRVYSQHLAIDGATDELPPSASNPNHYLGGFSLLEVAGAQPRTLKGILRSPSQAERLWLHNAGPQAIDLGWRLVATPRTDKYIV